MAISIDALTSPTLKYLRERWWNDEFTEFLVETLRPRAGNRILDVGCGEGLAEIHIGRLHLSQVRLVGVDLMIERVIVGRHETAAHNQRVGFATADACFLPFKDAVFDSTFCVAVLQHIGDVPQAVREFARVTAPGGRVVAVEPDNSARYLYSSSPAGQRVFAQSTEFCRELLTARRETVDATVGPHLPTMFAANGIEPFSVRMFPVSMTLLGSPSDALWEARKADIEDAMASVTAIPVRDAGLKYLAALDEYAAEAAAAGAGFVEIQNTMLFATVGQKSA
jgi:ubiquinone/menaquinone biosynthesis C-methylase UbiE